MNEALGKFYFMTFGNFSIQVAIPYYALVTALKVKWALNNQSSGYALNNFFSKNFFSFARKLLIFRGW